MSEEEHMVPNADHRAALVSSFANAAGIAAGVRSDQLSGPTPCPGYDVSVLVDHMVGAGWRAVALGKGESPGNAKSPHVELADVPGRLRRAGKEAEDAWSDDARLTATVTMPWGETYPGATTVDMYLTEMATHAWDLAAATGQLERLSPELAPVALEAARAMLKPEHRDAMGPGNPFAAEVPAPAGATAWERLAAFMGRPPRAWPPATQP
ncbi:MAG: TIGR03086 family metal-binding protein [Acidimicrobiales bacterium]